MTFAEAMRERWIVELRASAARADHLADHVFGFMTNTMKAMYIRTIGIYRAEAKIGLTNLTYNMMRCVQLGKPVYNLFLR